MLYPTPLWNEMLLFNQLVLNSRNVAAGKGYNIVSAGLEYPKGGRSKMDLTLKASQGGMT